MGGVLQSPAAFSIINDQAAFATRLPQAACSAGPDRSSYRVRLVSDHADFNQFMYQLYELKQIAFVGSPMNKV